MSGRRVLVFPFSRFCTVACLQVVVSLWLALLYILIPSGSFAAGDNTWKQALPGYRFEFPRDHASHPDYKIEWWYYTGNLVTVGGQHYGYQLTFFRIGIDLKPANPSRWAVRDLFMTHLAVTDIDAKRYGFKERINRAGIGWAGAARDSYHVWNEDWEVRLETSGHHRLRAVDAGLGVDLELEPGRPPVIHGEDGISQKGSQAGNASHYYSLTRMPTCGILKMEGESFQVSGFSWMDHEFGTSFLEAEQKGWDWFSLQLDDGTDLMLFQLRRSDGSRDKNSSGTLVEAQGKSLRIRSGEFELVGGKGWRSPQSGATYPIEWQVKIPDQELDLSVEAAIPNQELLTEESTDVTYWEGSIVVKGTRHGHRVQGRGYLEMTGYAGDSISTRFR
jgi:predicted secreted hydrolase